MTNRRPRRPSRLAAFDRKVGHFLANRRPGRRSLPPRPVGNSHTRGDEGFALLESLVAIALISVIMAAFTTFFVNAVASTAQQRAAQVATQIANSTVDTIRAVPASDLLKGRDVTSVNNQFNAASSTVAPWLSAGTQQAIDVTAATGSGPTAALPTAPVSQTIGPVSYSVNTYLSYCSVPGGATTNATCTPATINTGFLRAVVAVTWSGTRCPPTLCTYVTSTLLSTVDDPLFNLNQSPPPAPVMINPGNQTSAVGDTVNLVAAIVAVPTYRVALTTGTLPAGLFLNTATGNISGTPSAVTASTSLTLTVTDGFGRATTQSFTWTVVPALAGIAPAAQATFIGVALTSPLTVSATGGTLGYIWSDPGSTLPPGLTLSTVNNQASISGTPTTAGLNYPIPAAGQAFPVTLTVTDSAGRKASVSFTWTIGYPPMLVANPGSQTSSVGAPDTLTLTASGGSGSFTWTSTALPPGLTLSSGGVLSGTPTVVGTTSVTVTATDTKVAGSSATATFSWKVFAAPTVTSPGNQNVTVGVSVSLQLATTCPNTPCTYTLNNGPATLAISSSGLITGTITSAAQTFGSVTITVTDSAGAVVPSAAFVVKVNAVPTVANPGTQTVTPGTADTLDVSTLVTGGTAPLTYSATNLPSWLTLNASTGLISGTSPATALTSTGIVLTVRDALGVSASSTAFNWIVGGVPSAPQAATVVNGDTLVTASWSAPATNNGAAVTGYTATLIARGATVAAGSCTTTGALSCAIGGLTDGIPYTLTVTATNSYGVGPASTAVTAIPYPAVMSAANGMTLWLDGADPAALLGDSGCTGAVTTTSLGCWRDKSGLSNNFTQATVANQPTVGTKWNGLSAANFADTTDVLKSVSTGTNYYRSVFVAANLTTSNPYNYLFGQADSDNYNVRVTAGRGSPNANDFSYNTGTPPLNWTNGAQGVNANLPQQVITSDQASVVRSFTASVSNTFSNSGVSRGLVGQVGDVITFSTLLSTSQRRAVEEYLSNKWGVSITPQAPTAVGGVVASKTSVNVSWTAPTFNGGASVTGYTVTSSDGQTCSTTGALTCTISNLTKSTAYTFTVTASNTVGVGPQSSASSSVTPK